MHDPGLHNPLAQYDADDYERYVTYTLRSRYFIGRKLALNMQLPVHTNAFRIDENTMSRTSLGDPLVYADYLALSKEGSKFAARVWTGAGVKLPLGGQFPSREENLRYLHLMGGSGSLDVLLRTNASLRTGNLGFGVSGSYRINTTNQFGIRTGNFVNSSLNAFYVLKKNNLNWKIVPSIGGVMEHYSGVYENKERIDGTGATGVFASLGVAGYFKKFGIEIQHRQPVFQDLKGTQLKSRSVSMVELSYNFGGKG